MSVELNTEEKDPFDLEAKLARFDKRREESTPKENVKETQRIETLRQDYLKRTGRKEMKP